MPVWKLIDSTGNGLGLGAEARDTADEPGRADIPNVKFTFTATVHFRSGAQFGNEAMEALDIGLKSASRPQPIANYEEVNFYNYRTKVLTKIDYGNLTLSFYDDNKGKANSILRNYLTAVSPISNIPKEQASNLENLGVSAEASSVGPLENRYGVIDFIRVTQHFAKFVGGNFVPFKRNHDYLNPKIMNFQWDELDMDSVEFAMCTAIFVYDSVNILPDEAA